MNRVWTPTIDLTNEASLDNASHRCSKRRGAVAKRFARNGMVKKRWEQKEVPLKR